MGLNDPGADPIYVGLILGPKHTKKPKIHA